MPGDVITVAIPVGTLAALLTALEYLLSTAAALSARAGLHGLWLLRLHRGGKLPLDTVHGTRRRFQKDLVSFALGIWLVIGIALVESNLKEGVRIRNEAKESPLCVSVFGSFDPERLKNLRPPYRVTVEPWVLSVASSLQCRFGIASIGVGGTTDSFGNKLDMSAPVCVDHPVNITAGLVKADVSIVELEDGVVEPEVGDTEAFILFPLFRAPLGLGVDRVGLENEGAGDCGEVGISGVFWTLGAEYQTTFADALNISFAVHERICEEYGKLSREINTVDDEAVTDCADGKYLDVSCVRNGASTDMVDSVDIKDVAAVIVPKSFTGASYACLSATAQVEFVLLSARIAGLIMEDGNPELPVLLPTTVVVTHGYCERSIGGLAHVALLYTADSEWQDDVLAKIDRRIRFHALLMAVSASQFPLHNLTDPENPQGGSCLIREVYTVSEIEKDWRFWLLVTGLIVVVLVILVGGLMRLLFTKVWRVGSAEWSLAQFVEGDGDHKIAVEVVHGHGDGLRESVRGQRFDGSRWGFGSVFNWDKFEYHVRTGRPLAPPRSWRSVNTQHARLHQNSQTTSQGSTPLQKQTLCEASSGGSKDRVFC